MAMKPILFQKIKKTFQTQKQFWQTM